MVDLSKVRMAKSARGVPFSHSTLDVMLKQVQHDVGERLCDPEMISGRRDSLKRKLVLVN